MIPGAGRWPKQSISGLLHCKRAPLRQKRAGFHPETGPLSRFIRRVDFGFREDIADDAGKRRDRARHLRNGLLIDAKAHGKPARHTQKRRQKLAA